MQGNRVFVFAVAVVAILLAVEPLAPSDVQ